MALDTWQCDVVITTFVQLFQTLIGNRNKLLKKFNHFAGAILILDEVQTIRLGQLPLIGASLYYLSKFLNTRILLMTATKPKIFELANQEILSAEGEEATSLELLPNYEAVFSCFSRTKLISLIDQKLENETGFLDSVFLKRWQADRSCILVFNTVRRSMDVFREVLKNVDTAQNPVYYLSTNIVPVHRQAVIDNIKRDIANNLKPILVATQCVEAGVDLDFDMGFRDLGPIDSIIQVAGRINRNNNPDKKYSPLYVLDFGDCSKIYDAITQQQSRKVLKENPEIPEEQYLQLVEGYFLQIATNKSFQESRKIFDAMKHLKYDSVDLKNNPAVSSFQVINEKSPSLTVFIELDENASHLKDCFIQLIHKAITTEDFAPYKRRFHQHIVSVPGHLPKAADLLRSKKNLLCEGMYYVSKTELADFYDITTGFDRSHENSQHSMLL
jgi:CRISPR-associated endonuclease/helicase Cas3